MAIANALQHEAARHRSASRSRLFSANSVLLFSIVRSKLLRLESRGHQRRL